MSKKEKGFTLVELLVVIGIIALLISILLPSLNKARQQAQTVSCLSNLRSLGQAVAIYQSQYRSMPPLSQWSNGTFSGNRFRGYTLWALLNVKAGQKSVVCPSAPEPQPTWPTAQNGVRALYSYKYNWLLAGVETNTLVAPTLPHATVRDPLVPSYNPNPVKKVRNASETLTFVCYPQVVAFQTDDQLGSDRGMDQASIKPASTTRTINGDAVQSLRGIAPSHGLLKPSRYVQALSDGTMATMGLTNVLYADGSARSVMVVQGQFTATADPANRMVLDDSSNNGNIRGGNECIIEGTRLNPTLNP